jgi:DNA-binding beta-propeller fold protein YncE
MAGVVLVTDARNCAVSAIDLSNGAVVSSWGSVGSRQGQFQSPAGIAAFVGGGYAVADRGNDRVAFFEDLDGAGWKTFGSSGEGVGQLREPIAVATDEHGRILVADYGNRRIVRVDDKDGSGWTAFGAPGKPSAGDDAVGKFATPTSIAIDGKGRTLVADPEAGRVISVDEMDGSGWVSAGNNDQAALALNGPVAVTTQQAETIVCELSSRRLSLFAHFPAAPIERFDGVQGSLPLVGPTAAVATGPSSLAVLEAPIARLLHLDRGAGWTMLADLHLSRLGVAQPLGICVE